MITNVHYKLCNSVLISIPAAKLVVNLYFILPSQDDFIVPQRAPCMGCPMEVAENSEDLRVPLIASLSKYNSMSEHSHLFTVHSVGHATRQVEIGHSRF